VPHRIRAPEINPTICENATPFTNETLDVRVSNEKLFIVVFPSLFFRNNRQRSESSTSEIQVKETVADSAEYVTPFNRILRE
jgi:hypothetical protein